MPRKVFISVLGAGTYRECTYRGKNSETRTKYIQEATLLEIQAQSWKDTDAAYILLTNKAEAKHWLKSDDGEGLEAILKNLNLPCLVKGVKIPDGRDETEMWAIFQTAFDLLEDGDVLYFDLTHAFRYIPMLILVLSSYAKFLKNTTVAYMSYGNWEVSNENGGIAPIVDLLPLAVLQNWTSSAFAFKKMGNVRSLADAIREYSSLYADKSLSNSAMSLSKSLIKFESQIETCRGAEIVKGKVAEEVRSNIKVIEKSSLPKPIIEILHEIRSEIQPFETDSLNNIKGALTWCLTFGLVQQGYTLCQEGILTVICNKLADLNPFNTGDEKADQKSYRHFWSSILGVRGETARDESSWENELDSHRELARSCFAMDWVKSFRVKYSELTKRRDQLNHAGFTGAMTSGEIIDKFKEIVEKCMEIFDMSLTISSETPAKPSPTYFINVSNHPIGGWSESQRKAAESLGELKEIQFPNVDPTVSNEALMKLTDETYSRIMSITEGKAAVVHIMGEMTLTYALVSRLKASGIRCVASTTQRVVKELGDGKRETTFSFVSFRDYQ